MCFTYIMRFTYKDISSSCRELKFLPQMSQSEIIRALYITLNGGWLEWDWGRIFPKARMVKKLKMQSDFKCLMDGIIKDLKYTQSLIHIVSTPLTPMQCSNYRDISLAKKIISKKMLAQFSCLEKTIELPLCYMRLKKQKIFLFKKIY